MNMNYGTSCSEMEDWRRGGLFALRDPGAQCFGVFVYFNKYLARFYHDKGIAQGRAERVQTD